MKRLLSAIGLVGSAAAAISCGTTTPTTPGPTGVVLTVSAVTPSSLSTTGGASVTITGTGFGTDTAVSVDGVAISGATVTSTSVTVNAPTHAAGAGAFVVSSGGKTATAAVTFVAPSGANLPPTITNIRTIGSRNNQPTLFVDLNEEVQLIATVSNVETNTMLTYTWTVGAGTISGTGASVLWKLPTLLTTTPTPVAATLTVTETYTENSVQHRNVATSSVLADAHDSSTEILNKGFQFLDRFSQSQYPPSEVLADFATTCPGYPSELADTIKNRTNYLQLPGYSVTRLPPVEFKFGESCVWTAYGPNATRIRLGDACAQYRVHWIVRAIIDVNDDGVHIPLGTVATTDGRDFVTFKLLNGQWKLCESDFFGELPTTLVEPSGLTRTVATLPGMAPGRIRRQ